MQQGNADQYNTLIINSIKPVCSTIYFCECKNTSQHKIVGQVHTAAQVLKG